MLERKIEEMVVTLLRLAVTRLPIDVKEALKKAKQHETNKIAQMQLDTILRNIQLSEDINTPICQDTGTITFYLTIGDEFPVKGKLPEILRNATKHATEIIPLRPNAVNPFTGRNNGDNIGENIPYINWEIVSGDKLQVTVLPKGGGSENACALGMLNPNLGLSGMKRFVVDTLIEAGAKPCPPVILGVAVGGGSDIAMSLAKKALLRPINKRHKDARIAKLEEELFELTNQTGIGPMGLGGDTTVLDVNMEYAYRHPASLPVGVAIQCWAARRATAEIWPDERIEYLTHKT
jgi:fumarate hydratase subunit alpha